MNKNKPAVQPAAVPPSRLVWDDERLSALDKQQLTNLLGNLQTQLDLGRISGETAADLERRILSRLPKSARPKSARTEKRTLDNAPADAADSDGSTQASAEN